MVSSENDTVKTIDIEIRDSAAVAVVRGITLLKVEQGNNSHALSGAEYTLSCWDGNQFNPISDIDGQSVFVTKADGTIAIRTDRFHDLKYNTAYCFKEVKAPDGYIRADQPYYFYVRHMNTVQHPENLPENFFTELAGNAINDGALIYMDNRKNATSIQLTKEWIDVDGAERPEIGRPVEVKLYRHMEGVEKKELCGTYSLTAENNWTIHITNLPANVIGEDGTEMGDYLYTVEEISCPMFQVSYVNNGGINSGEIKIVNRKESNYQLPDTGGSGTVPFYVAGAGLIGLSLLVLKKKYGRTSDSSPNSR